MSNRDHVHLGSDMYLSNRTSQLSAQPSGIQHRGLACSVSKGRKEQNFPASNTRCATACLQRPTLAEQWPYWDPPSTNPILHVEHRANSNGVWVVRASCLIFRAHLGTSEMRVMKADEITGISMHDELYIVV
ncbi:hypothetical protein FOCG_18572 [Fusarium oxysporum f. sp. radicis-lycopersici 26381]|nr:hypothetical protein FOCG_18572 [Fusarium oxysporum f. sp. radicis-lycopersici 26381]